LALKFSRNNLVRQLGSESGFRGCILEAELAVEGFKIISHYIILLLLSGWLPYF
jgi:hypothetical protein